MGTKGASNHYGNAKHGKQGHITNHTGFAWAKDFNKHTLSKHVEKHGQNYGEAGYVAKAVSFANRVDRDNHVSYIRKNGETVKYSKKTNEFVIVDKKGYIVTYYHPREGIKHYLKDMEEHK